MKNRRILIIAAHPDDEVLGCGGVIAKYAFLGASINILFITGGITSRYNLPSHQMDDELLINRQNAIAANKILGVPEGNIHFLEFEDQKLDAIPLLDLSVSIKGYLSELKPDTVYCHHYGDYNKDHRIVFEAVLHACRLTPDEVFVEKMFAYEVLSSTERSFGTISPFIPDTYVAIDQFIELKSHALCEYTTEIREYPHARSTEGIETLAKQRGIEVGLPFAEAFQLIRMVEV